MGALCLCVSYEGVGRPVRPDGEGDGEGDGDEGG